MSRSRAILGAIVFAGLSATSLSAQHSLHDHLYASDDGGDVLPCTDVDTEGASENAIFRQAIVALGLEPSQIIFYRCAGARFGTRIIRDRMPMRYGITIPGGITDQSELLGAILHELAHASQLQGARSVHALRSRSGSAKIELGADYVAGFLIGHRLGLADRAAFQRNLNLIGDYDTVTEDWHGCPEHRLTAFRSGFYERNADDLQAAVDRFLGAGFDKMIKSCGG